jgi:hypothetical protein
MTLAQARWRVEVAQAVLKGHKCHHRKDRRWEIEEALHRQQLENAEKYLRMLSAQNAQPSVGMTMMV